jgi:hypothetical protein
VRHPGESVVTDAEKLESDFGEHIRAAQLRAQLAEAVIEFSTGTSEMTYKPSAVNDLLFSSLAVARATAQTC